MTIDSKNMKTLFRYHDFDWYTQACIKCGATRECIEDGVRENSCNTGETVVGITHLIIARRFTESGLNV